ncbi:MAG TPA: tetratricopeptide repeat protein [Pirellulales bacterium]|nr:tetratricopeptide repeat protein [Pirellulales bacterium]
MEESWLRGKRVAVTGRLVSMTHAEFAELVAARGGEFLPLPNRGTALLVIGQDGWPLEPNGRQTVGLARARRLRALGYAIELLSEDEFYGRLNLVEPQNAIHRRCTINQLSRVLNLPGRRLRSWLRAGLIEPVEVIHRLAYFDFRQASSAKNLCELTAAGVKPQHVRESLEQLRNWLPGIDAPLAQLSLLESDGRLLVRLDDDQIADSGGQLHFDFVMGSPGEAEVVVLGGKTAEAWFEEGLELEDRERPAEAVAAYREAIRLAPDDPVLHFNLGNALLACHETDEAAEQFRRAVSCDPCYVEAWNNLGNVLDEGGDFDGAIDAYERALRFVPSYADAHYNLAETLIKVGRDRDAARHLRAYLQFDRGSSRDDADMTTDARVRLAEMSLPPTT